MENILGILVGVGILFDPGDSSSGHHCHRHHPDLHLCVKEIWPDRFP